MARPRLSVTEQRELRHLSAISSAGGTLPVITNARSDEGIDGRSARALAGKEMVRLALADGQLLCTLTSQGETRLAALRLKSN